MNENCLAKKAQEKSVRTATEILSSSVRATLPHRKKVIARILSEQGYICDDDTITVSEAEKRSFFHHNVMFWLKYYRSIRAEVKALYEVMDDYLPTLTIEQQEVYKDRLQEKADLVNLTEQGVSKISKVLLKDGEIVAAVIRYNYFDGDDSPSEPWNTFVFAGRSLTRYKWYNLLHKGEDALEAIYFGTSRRQDEEILLRRGCTNQN